jgi:hypothetical protein
MTSRTDKMAVGNSPAAYMTVYRKRKHEYRENKTSQAGNSRAAYMSTGKGCG